jgi:hypothetical protein
VSSPATTGPTNMSLKPIRVIQYAKFGLARPID